MFRHITNMHYYSASFALPRERGKEREKERKKKERKRKKEGKERKRKKEGKREKEGKRGFGDETTELTALSSTLIKRE